MSKSKKEPEPKAFAVIMASFYSLIMNSPLDMEISEWLKKFKK
jgi:hypothetical protein